MRGLRTALGLTASLLAAGCVEDAYRGWLSAQDAGSVDGSTNGAPDGGPDASMPAFDAGLPLDGGCPSGCTSDWATFLLCGPQGATLCPPATMGFTGQATRAAFHGPGAGFLESSLAFADDGVGTLWVAVAGDGGVRILYPHVYTKPIQSLVVDDEHDDNGSLECVDAFFSDSSGMAQYAFACGGTTGYGTVVAPGPFSGLSWLPSQDNGLNSIGGCFATSGGALSYSQVTPGMFQVTLVVQADRIQSLLSIGAADAGCPKTFGEWWLLSQSAGGLIAEPACVSGNQLPVVPPGGLSITANVRMTGLAALPVAAVAGWDGGHLFGFAVYDDLSTSASVAWLATDSGVVSGLEISSWGSSNTVRAGWLDAAGLPHLADLDISNEKWGAPFDPTGPATPAQFVAPMYPNMLLTVSSGQVVIRYVP